MDLSRRQALALPGLLCLAGCGGPEKVASSGTVLANLADLPLDQLVVKDNVVLRRTSDTEVTALSAVCPHAGCTVGASGDALACPCHGSAFDGQGKVTKGPAREDLPAVAVTVKDGKVLVA